MPNHPDPITRFVRACDPQESLRPNDPRYVNLDDVRGDNLAAVYARALRRADPSRPEVRIFTGHRGVGKTSELFRLQAELERPVSGGQPHAPFKVVYFDVRSSLDLNDLDFPDLLVAAAAEVRGALGDVVPEFGLLGRWLDRFGDDVKHLLGSEVTLTAAEVDSGFVSLAAELKARPNSRRELRTAIEQHGTGLRDAVNDLLEVATVELRERGMAGLVLIIDGLDKLVLRPLEDGSTNTHVRLFCDRADQLASLHAHVVYTAPISLIYSPQAAQLEQTFGEFNVPIAMVKLREERAEIDSQAPGMLKLVEMIEARAAHASVDPQDLFDHPSTREKLCRMTGGHPRHLLTFLRAACDQVDALPLTEAAVDRAIRNYANSLFREVPDKFWELLSRFDTPQDDIPRDERHQQMLFFLHVFEYMNGRPWYEVNPVLRTIDKFARPV